MAEETRVHIVMAEDHLEGVYSTKEKAEAARDEMNKHSEYPMYYIFSFLLK